MCERRAGGKSSSGSYLASTGRPLRSDAPRIIVYSSRAEIRIKRRRRGTKESPVCILRCAPRGPSRVQPHGDACHMRCARALRGPVRGRARGRVLARPWLGRTLWRKPLHLARPRSRVSRVCRDRYQIALSLTLPHVSLVQRDMATARIGRTRIRARGLPLGTSYGLQGGPCGGGCLNHDPTISHKACFALRVAFRALFTHRVITV